MSTLRLPALASALLALVLLLGCAAPRTAPRERSETGRPAVADFVADPPLALVRIAPDGESVVGIASREGTQVLFHKPLRGDEVRFLAKFDTPGRVIHEVGWSGDRTVVLLIEELGAVARDGARRIEALAFRLERWRALRLGEGWSFTLPPGADADAAILHWLPEDPERVLVSEWRRSEPGASVRRVRVRDGVGEVVAPASLGARRWFADAAGRVRAAIVREPEGLAETVYARSGAEDDLAPLVAADLVEETNLAFAGFARDSRTIYVTALGDDGRRALYRYDLTRSERGERVIGDAEVDVGPFHYAPGSRELRAVEVLGAEPAVHALEPALAREQASIEAAFPGTRHRIASVDGEGHMAIVEVSGDTHPPESYVYDRARRQMDFLFAALPELRSEDLAPTRPVRYPARDGRSVPGYLTLPPGVEPRGLPVIVVVHDGPAERAVGGWDPLVQLLASRGFAVLQPNYRGSSGYGREHERAGERAWGGALQHDLVDGVTWLVGEGIGDADRIGIYGAGFGGSAALLALVKAPGLYRAAACFGAVMDWSALLDAPERIAFAPAGSPVAGAGDRDRERLDEISPARHAGAVRAPVLIGHGELDPFAPAAQARAMAEALAAAGGEVELRIYRDEARVLRRERERIDFHERLLAFFERSLRARAAL